MMGRGSGGRGGDRSCPCHPSLQTALADTGAPHPDAPASAAAAAAAPPAAPVCWARTLGTPLLAASPSEAVRAALALPLAAPRELHRRGGLGLPVTGLVAGGGGGGALSRRRLGLTVAPRWRGERRQGQRCPAGPRAPLRRLQLEGVGELRRSGATRQADLLTFPQAGTTPRCAWLCMAVGGSGVGTPWASEHWSRSALRLEAVFEAALAQ